MKTAILCAALLLLLAPAASWRYVASTSQERYYVAPDRTDRDRDAVRTWEKQEPRDDTGEGKVRRDELVNFLSSKLPDEAARAYSYSTVSREYDCPRGLARFLQYLYHRADGRVLYSTPAAELPGWQSPPPDSIAERMMLDACKRPAEKY
jgi:hypothetical protein